MASEPVSATLRQAKPINVRGQAAEERKEKER
jgi:hypothetical protein